MAWTVDGLTYNTRKKLTIDQTKIDTADLTDFPCLVKLTSTNFDFTKSNADGFDIRFTQSDGSTLLKYERERHDNINSLAEYWVKIPTVEHDVDTDFYMYFRTTDTADGADPTNVWDSNYVAVYHMKDLTTSTVEDSTSNSLDGTKQSANHPIEANGKIAKGQNFTGVANNDYFSLGDITNFDTLTKFSMEFWFSIPTPGVYHYLMEKGVDPDASSFEMYIGSDNGFQLRFFNSEVGANYGQFRVSDISAYQDGAFHHCLFQAELSTETGTLYIDGGVISLTKQEYGTGLPTSIVNKATSLVIGGTLYGAGYSTRGILDEIRLSKIVRLAEYAKASYNSGNDTLLTYGGEDTGFKPISNLTLLGVS